MNKLIRLVFVSVLPFAACFPANNNFPIGEWTRRPRINGGRDISDISQVPHHVTLSVYPTSENETFCEGSLISTQFVLTAAVCFNAVLTPNYTVIIYFGAADLNNTKTVRIPTRVIFHPKWNNKTLENNLAILEFKAVRLSPEIQPIRLPSRTQESESFSSWKATITGRGQSTNNELPNNRILRGVGTKVVPNYYCKSRHLFSTITDTNICTSYFGSEGICKGDEGGPLFITDIDNKDTLIGAASFRDSNCESSLPSVFTRVASYLVWINGVTSIPIRE